MAFSFPLICYAIWSTAWNDFFRDVTEFFGLLPMMFRILRVVLRNNVQYLFGLIPLLFGILRAAFRTFRHDVRQRVFESKGPGQAPPPAAPPTTPPTQREPQAPAVSSSCFDWAREKIRRRYKKIDDEEKKLGANGRTRPDGLLGEASNGTAEEGPAGEKTSPELDVPADGQNSPES